MSDRAEVGRIVDLVSHQDGAVVRRIVLKGKTVKAASPFKVRLTMIPPDTRGG